MRTLLLIVDNGDEQGVASLHPTLLAMLEALMDTLEESIRKGDGAGVAEHSDDHQSCESREKGQWHFWYFRKNGQKKLLKNSFMACFPDLKCK